MPLIYKLSEVQTDDPIAVSEAIRAMVIELYPTAKGDRISSLIDTTVALFKGQIKPYQAIDACYHDLEHTMQVTLCWMRLFYNLKLHGPYPEIPFSYCMIGLASALFHDTGYLKEQHDEQGTGAKYTLIHESRSCHIAANVLSERNWPDSQIAIVQRFISTTGSRAVIAAIPYENETEKALAQALASADFLAQLSDPHYLVKLPLLYAEFEEAADHRHVPDAQRPFKSLENLIEETPAFWHRIVFPKLSTEFNSLYKFLDCPYPEGTNPYLEQAILNIGNLSTSEKQS